MDLLSDGFRADEDEDCKLVAVELHSTTSRHDDWLHRGALLADVPWLIYMMYVQRVRKPTASNADYRQLFFFDEHYALSLLYCQQIRYCSRLAIPRIVGSVCPPMEEDNGEAHALYKLMLFSRTRCPGKLACADPMNFRSWMVPSDEPDRPQIEEAIAQSLKSRSKPIAQPLHETQKPKFSSSWKACRCEFESKAQTAIHKCHLAKKEAVLADTTTMKDRSGDSHPAVLRAMSLRVTLLRLMGRYFDKHTHQMPFGLVQLVDIISCFVCGDSCYLPEQMHLAEFAALKMKQYNEAVDMDILVRKKPFRDEKQGGFVNDVVIQKWMDALSQLNIQAFGAIRGKFLLTSNCSNSLYI